MGDRANIKIKIAKDKPALYIYSHWSGTELPSILQAALKLAVKWLGDWSYFTRILVDQVTKEGRDQETGWGLGFQPDDNEHNLLVVDCTAKTVKACQFSDDDEHEGADIATVTFTEYLALPDPNGWRDMPALPVQPQPEAAPAGPDWAVLGPRLAAALKGAQQALRKALPHCPADEEHNGDSVFVGEWLDEVNEVVALLPAPVLTTSQQIRVRACQIICNEHPEWGTWGVMEDKGEYFEIHGDRGGRVLFKSEADQSWSIVSA